MLSFLKHGVNRLFIYCGYSPFCDQTLDEPCRGDIKGVVQGFGELLGYLYMFNAVCGCAA